MWTKKMERMFFSPSHAYKLKMTSDDNHLRFLVGEEGSLDEGEQITFYLLVDVKQALIQTISYQVFAEPEVCIASESLCELVSGKNLLQASRIGVDLLEKNLRDHSHQPALCEEKMALLNKVISAFYQALEGCEDLSLLLNHYSTPLQQDEEMKPLIEPSLWLGFSKEEKMALIRNVLEHDVQPFVELDAGGVEVKDLINDFEVILVYKGSCTSCYSSIGATLNSIDKILKQKIHPQIFVTPDKSVLNF